MTPRRYLLVASMPTPNGRLHLGHIGGPFLRLDVAARYLRSRGHQALVMTGTDPFESHVLLRAELEGRTPDEVAREHTAAIRRDLAALDIRCDAFVDPLDPRHQALYARHCLKPIQRLREIGAARDATLRWPFLVDANRFAPRSYLEGRCPACDAPAAGSVCEPCGQPFRAQDLLAPRLRATASRLEWRDVSTLELRLAPDDARLAAILRTVEALGLPARHAAIATRHLRGTGAHAELTVPGSWGVRWPGEQVIFSYATSYASALMMRELAEADAATVTITSFGADITVGWVATAAAFAELDPDNHERWLRYDHYWPNELLRLAGSKFSTSRGHVIGAEALVTTTPITSDLARLYLATIDPIDEETDFRVEELVATGNEVLRGELWVRIAAAFAEVAEPTAPPPPLVDKALADQAAVHDLDGFRLDRAAALIRSFACSRCDDYWYLKTLALLCAPLLPRLAQDIWSRLGADGEPRLARFQERTRPTPGRFPAPLPRLSASDLRPCLPAGLVDA